MNLSSKPLVADRWFFRSNGEQRIHAAADPAFEAYLKRCPPKTGAEPPHPAETEGMP